MELKQVENLLIHTFNFDSDTLKLIFREMAPYITSLEPKFAALILYNASEVGVYDPDRITRPKVAE